MHTRVIRLLLNTLLATVALASAGCSAQHYTKVQGDTVTLYYKAPEATTVFFAYSIDHFRYHPAKISRSGTWEVSVPATDEFLYFYLVDGQVAVPECDFIVRDDFGSYNCLHPLSL